MSASGRCKFQSTLPIREETPCACSCCMHCHFNPLFPYGKRPAPAWRRRSAWPHFNPLFPYGKRPSSNSIQFSGSPFQSTLPIREETQRKQRFAHIFKISIHSSHTGRDGGSADRQADPGYFNPLFPYGKRLYFDFAYALFILISIHSSHTGRDAHRLSKRRGGGNFNPLFPYGKRHDDRPIVDDIAPFQSTLPIREETVLDGKTRDSHRFQSTLPIREETFSFPSDRQRKPYFNPLFPYGKRRAPFFHDTIITQFQSTLPIREETSKQTCMLIQRIFQSTLPIREET